MEHGKDMQPAVLQVQNLRISFQTTAGKLRAVRGVDFTLHKGETLAIVGESGSGKSVSARAIAGMMSENEKIEEGSILYTCEKDGSTVTEDILKFSRKRREKELYGKKIAMVFQDPMTALNPLLTIETQLTEGIRKHLSLSKKEAYKRGLELLAEVGITVDISTYEWGALLDSLNAGEHEMFLLGWSNSSFDADGSTYQLFYSGNHGATGNRAFLTDDKVDELIINAQKESDDTKRMGLYKEIQDRLHEISPWCPLYYKENNVGVRADLKGFTLHAGAQHYLGNCHYEE